MGLEGWIAKNAALHRTDEHLRQLARCIEQGAAAAATGDFRLSARWREGYRAAYDAACGNPAAHEVVERLREPVDRVLNITMPEESAPRWAELAELRDAIADRDGPCARYLVLTQLSDAVNRFEGSDDNPLYVGERHWQRGPSSDPSPQQRYGWLI